jgi:hypothetical protein
MGKGYRVAKYKKVDDYGNEDELVEVVRSKMSKKRVNELRGRGKDGMGAMGRIGMRWRGGEVEDFLGSMGDEDFLGTFRR